MILMGKNKYKNFINDVLELFIEIILKPLLLFGPIILIALTNNFYCLFLLVITLPILYNMDPIDYDY